MATAQAAPAKDSGKKAAPVAMRPFFTGTLDLETRTKTYAGTVPDALTPLDTFYPKTNGFLADLWIDVSVTTAGNSAAAAFNEDMPWSFLATVQLSDTGGQPILGPLTGWELKTFVKWGGFAFSDDPQQSQTYSATTGTGATGGSFGFVLQLPVQFVKREPLGPLPNTNSNNAYALDITLAAEASVYSTPPTSNGTYSVKIALLAGDCVGLRRAPLDDSVHRSLGHLHVVGGGEYGLDGVPHAHHRVPGSVAMYEGSRVHDVSLLMLCAHAACRSGLS